MLAGKFSLVRGPMAMTLRRRRVRPETIVHAVVAAAYLRAELLPAPVCLQNVCKPHTSVGHAHRPRPSPVVGLAARQTRDHLHMWEKLKREVRSRLRRGRASGDRPRRWGRALTPNETVGLAAPPLHE